MRDESEILKDWIEFRKRKPLPQDVIFGGKKFGVAVDEVVEPENAGDLGDYVKIIQRVVDDDGTNPWVRFTYYRKRDLNSPWRIAGQTSMIAAASMARELVDKATKKGLFND